MTEKLDRETMRKIVAAINQADLVVDAEDLKINSLAIQDLRLRIGKLVMKEAEEKKLCYPELIMSLTEAINDVVRMAKHHYINKGKL